MNVDLLTRPPLTTRSVDEGILFKVYERTVVPRALRLLPAGLQPNAITMVGHCCALLGVIAAAAAVAGRPAFYLVSAALFMTYLFADILDGMHARETGQTSQTGEMLDHGLDAIGAISALLAVGLVLRVEGGVLIALAYTGMLSFVAAYWEQYRTGLLLCPAVGQSEAFTSLTALEVSLFLFHEPAWLKFSFRSPTVGTILAVVVLLGSAGPLLGTVRRVAKLGIPPGQLVRYSLASLAPVGYFMAGAVPWITGVLIGLLAGDVVVRSIRLRRKGLLGPLVTWPHAAMMLPLAAAFLPGGPRDPTALAWLGAVILAGMYAVSVTRGLRECHRAAGATGPAARSA